MPDEFTVRACNLAELPDLVPHLARILVDCVEGGASVNFMHPYSQADAEAFFRKCVVEAENGQRVILAAFAPSGVPLGTVQLVLDTPPNQPHRADVVKLLIHRSARNRGLAGRLMLAVEDQARQCRRTLLVLDTVTGSTAERLYQKLGWAVSGVIPGYALMPDGSGPVSTTVFWKKIPDSNNLT